MNELKQIRERFLADARQHFLAGDTTKRTTPCSTQRKDDRCYCIAQESLAGRDSN